MAATTDSDRNADQLTSNEFDNMKKLSDRFVAAHASRNYTSDGFFFQGSALCVVACRTTESPRDPGRLDPGLSGLGAAESRTEIHL